MASLVFLTGLSGAGMSSALKALEDIGYEVFDNFPAALIDALLDDPETDLSKHPVAIGLDVRSRGFDIDTLVQQKEKRGAALLFMACDRETLAKRFSETRRTHPLAKDRPVSIGINEEIKLLSPLKQHASWTIDTTRLSVHDLKRLLANYFRHDVKAQTLMINMRSFGFKHGLPSLADIVMDVRFLKNPHWEEALRPLTGLDEDIGTYIQTDPGFSSFIEKFKALLTEIIPRYQEEGKAYLNIAIGCTGGKHRSVFITELLAHWLANHGHQSFIEHRDLNKGK